MSGIPTDTAGLALTPREAAPILRVKGQTLKRWRAKGIGPAYVRLEGGRVRYRLSDLEAWLAANTVAPGSAAVQED